MKSGQSIIVNGRSLGGVGTGAARYVRSLYGAINTEHLAKVAFYYRGRLQEHCPGPGRASMGRFLPTGIAGVVRRVLRARDDWRMNTLLKQHQADVFHEPGSIAPRRVDVPVVLTVYDLSLLRYPEFHPPDRVRYFERFFARRLKTVDHILTLSSFIRQEMIDLLGVCPERVTAIPLAADPVFRRREQTAVERQLASKKWPRRYLLCVGAQEPRKNLELMVRALPLMKTYLPVICVGWGGWLRGNLEREIDKHGIRESILFIGAQTDEDLALLYSGAVALVYPSWYEGFGLPVLEAMACGCPVVCSDRASLPEVAGSAAIQLSPNDTAGFARTLTRLVDDETLRRDLKERGFAQARKFSWKDTARRTVLLFERICSMQV